MILEGPVGRYLMDLIENLLVEVKNEGGGKRALDIGCGYGYYTSKLLEMGYIVDAVDISAEHIAIAKKRAKKTGNYSNVNFYNVDLFEFDTDKKYDVVICLEVLEHLENDVKALKLMNNWLKDDGHLIISTPHRQDLWNFRDEMAGHLRRYSKEEMKKKLKMANFKAKKMLCYGFPFVRLFLTPYLKIEEGYVKMQNKSLSNGSTASISGKRRKIVRIFGASIRTLKKMAVVLRYLFKFDNLFFDSDRGFGLVILAEIDKNSFSNSSKHLHSISTKEAEKNAHTTG